MDRIEQPHWELHSQDDKHCNSCARGFPHPCACGGTVHGEITTMPDGGYVQVTHCDRCGSPRAGSR